MLKKTKLWSIIRSINLVLVLFFWYHENPINHLGLSYSGRSPELSDFRDIIKFFIIAIDIVKILFPSWIYNPNINNRNMIFRKLQSKLSFIAIIPYLKAEFVPFILYI